MPDAVKNKGASVRARLLNLARQRGQTHELLLTRYALERLLYRLSISAYTDRFVLKGAMLLMTWLQVPFRATRDLDFLGFGSSDSGEILEVFKAICAIDAGDGVTFDAQGLSIDTIREELAYGGLRLITTASIAGAQVKVSIDIGFGDATEPGLRQLDYPVLLDDPVPRLRAYPPETVIAEKFQAMVALGHGNTRLKDFYDVWLLFQTSRFEDDRLPRAIVATFQRRQTSIPIELPEALTAGFSDDPQKQQQWKAFVRSLEGEAPDFAAVISDLGISLMSAAARARAR